MNERSIETHNDDRIKMARAVRLSRTSPEAKTFRVGCVITDKNGKEIATGFTGEEAGFHAEEIAIRKLKAEGREEEAKGGSIFSTVEPCHPRKSGKTSCTDHILTLGLARVLYVLDEPEVFVKCEGAKTLRERGLQVAQMPELQDEVLEINKHIIKPKELGGVCLKKLEPILRKIRKANADEAGRNICLGEWIRPASASVPPAGGVWGGMRAGFGLGVFGNSATTFLILRNLKFNDGLCRQYLFRFSHLYQKSYRQSNFVLFLTTRVSTNLLSQIVCQK